MAEPDVPNSARRFGRVDARRMLVFFAVLGATAMGCWFVLPVIQSWIIPRAPGGVHGPWVIRPEGSLHFAATAISTAVTAAFIFQPLKKRWRHVDAERGTEWRPHSGRPVRRALFLLKALFLSVIYAFGFALYIFSWTTIGPSGIEQRLPWTKLAFTFHDIAALETIPEGDRSESIQQNGPWYAIHFKTGRYIALSEDNEGLSPDELRSIVAFVAEGVGLDWKPREDSRPR